MVRSTGLVAMMAAVALAAAACGGGTGGNSSSSGAPATSGSSGSTAGGSSKTITVGVITDASGLGASGEAHIEAGVKAGVYAAAKQGYKIKYVMADSQTNPSAVQAAATKLVTQDHVDVVLGSSAVFFGAARYLTAQGVPVVGFAQDGPEWLTSKNMFSNAGRIDPTKVTTTYGKLAKDLGAKTIGAVGYSISPSSAESAKGTGASAEAAGLDIGYINAKFPFGSTNVEPVALAMRDAHVDAVFPQVDPNTSFALLTALKNNGVKLKLAMLPIGYGGDLLQSGPATLAAADGVYFGLQFQPVELNTPATRTFLADLAATGGTQTPGLPVYTGYTSILLLVAGLQHVPADEVTNKAAIINGLSQVHSFDAGGLTGKPFDPNDPENVLGPNNCSFIVQLQGQKFVKVANAEPICGTVIAGKGVSP
jgi:ABC-type branched-subunit amino acid transport system substrate-binding protein